MQDLGRRRRLAPGHQEGLTGDIVVGDQPSQDFYSVAAQPLDGVEVGGAFPQVFLITLMASPPEDPITSTALPLSPPGLGDFSTPLFELTFSDAQTTVGVVQGQIDAARRPAR
jgi:hypothetical protein